MTQARRSSKRKRGKAALSKKAALALGAAGVSLAMTGAASATAPATNVPSQDNARRLILAEEEISDVSLATFQVFDRENPPLSQGIRVRAWRWLRRLRVRSWRRGWRMRSCRFRRWVRSCRGRLRRWRPLCCRSLCRWWPLRLSRRLRLRWRIFRRRLLGLRRLHRNLLAMGPVPGSVGLHLLLG